MAHSSNGSGEVGQPDGTGYLQKLLTADCGAIGFDQLQRSDLQLLLNARGKPIHGTREVLEQRLRQVVSEEVSFRWAVHPHVAWAPKREWPSLVSYADRLYLFGGRDEEEMLLVFKPTSGKFEPVDVWPLPEDFPTTLSCPATLVHDNRLWIFGGRSASVEACTSDMYVYDFDSNLLDSVQQTGTVPYPREGASVAVFEGKMLLYGGVNSLDASEEDNFEPRRHVLSFDFETLKWTTLVTSGTYPGPKETVEAVAMHGNWMYVLTWDAEEGLLLYRLDVPKKKWGRVQQQGQVPHPRCEFSTVNVGGQLVIHGGYLRDDSHGADGWLEDPTNETYAFSFDTHTWSRVVGQVNLLARGQHSACVYRGSIVFAGGDVRRGRGCEGEEEESEEFEEEDMENVCDHVEALQLLPQRMQNSYKAANCEVAARLRPFYNNQAHSDVVLRAGDQAFCCHKLLLAAQSATFDRMFQSGMREGSSGEVVVDDMRPEVLEALLKYIYGCQDDITPQLVIDLFRAADHYQIESLRAECLDLMMSHVDVDNAAAFAVLADGHDIPDLLQTCIKFAAEPANITQVASSAAFLDLMKSRPELAQQFTVGLLTGHMNLKRKPPAKPKRKRGN